MRMRSAASSLLLAAMALLLALISAAPAGATFGFQAHSFESTLLDEAESPDLQAGSHPFAMTTSFAFNMRTNLLGQSVSDGDVKDVAVELPPGLIGNPSATPKCTAKEFHTQSAFSALEGSNCPGDTQVGLAVATVSLGSPYPVLVGVYNLVPPPGVPAAFGFNPIGLAITLLP